MEGKKETKKSWPLIALVLVAVLGVIGGAIAYFTSSDTFTNVFRTQPYRVEVSETFVSPENWTPGTTTPKTVVAKNTGDVDVAVRVSYTEGWVDSQNITLPLIDENNNQAAIINLTNNGWTKVVENGQTYYYYNTKLTKNQTTNSFMSGVTFNENVTINTIHNCEDDAETHTRTCVTSTGGYAGGTYTLTVNLETVQFDQYKEAWNTTFDISE